MTKPLNARRGGCNPVSSDCVTYNGREMCDDIPLCLNSSVTEVLEGTMKKLCEISELLNVDSYAIENSCLENECGIKNFTDLINILIVNICKIKETINENEQEASVDGNVVSNSISKINDQLNTLSESVSALNIKDTNEVNRINNLIDSLRDEFEQKLKSKVSVGEYTDDFNSIVKKSNSSFEVSTSVRDDLGTTQDVLSVISRMMGNNISMRKMLSDNRTYGQHQNWIANPSNIAQAFNNEWVVVDDILRATSAMFTDYEGADCSSIILSVMCEAISTTQIKVDFIGNIPAGFTDDLLGSTIEIYERNSGIPQRINGVNVISEYYRTHNSLIIDLNGVSAVNELTVRVLLRSNNLNNGSHCERIFDGTCLVVNSCPNVLYTPSYNSVVYQFTWNGSATVMEMQLYSSNQENLLARLTINANQENMSGSIGNLAEGTTYMARLVINGVPCEFKSFTTAAHACLSVQGTSITFEDDYTNPVNGVDGRTIATWISEH